LQCFAKDCNKKKRFKVRFCALLFKFQKTLTKNNYNDNLTYSLKKEIKRKNYLEKTEVNP